MITMKTNGLADSAALFFQDFQLKDRELWRKFVDIYRTHPDSKNYGWRGEYWGKMMRGTCLVYGYTKDEELYAILTETIRDMFTVAEEDGRVSSYERHNEFDAWDIWCRKYVILGCEYFLEICKDEAFKKEIISFISRCADHILKHIGSGEAQKEITDATRHWLGINSSSLLEPIVKLYRLTNEKKYLDFATYIVNTGAAKGINIFKLALEDELYPYQYGVSKAYEMMSCFEGLLEYYYVTGIEEYKTAVINFSKAVIKTELSVIGCSGITHELFDYTKARQTVRQKDVLQETCVTVTWIKLCGKLLALTKDPCFADCIEQSFYNAYLGALNVHHKDYLYLKGKNVHGDTSDVKTTLLPIDSYSPLLSGKRGVYIGGFQILDDKSYYGCCACIASAGVGTFMQQMITADDEGITVNFFEQGKATLKYKGAKVEISQKTEYPVNGKIEIAIKTDAPVEFTLKVRVPEWTGKTEGYAVYKKEWLDDKVELDFDMPIRTQKPQQWDEETVYVPEAKKVYHNPDDDNYIALMRGPLTLAVDSNTGTPADSVFDFEPVGELCADNMISVNNPCLLKMKFIDREGKPFYMVDYASAGKYWDTDIAAWLRTK